MDKRACKKKRKGFSLRQAFNKRHSKVIISAMTEDCHDKVISKLQKFSGRDSEIVLDVGGLSHTDQYELAIQVKKQVTPSIRTRVVVQDGPFSISAEKLQTFIRLK